MQRMDECYNRIEKLKSDGFGQDNKSSIAQLFLSFFGQVTAVSLVMSISSWYLSLGWWMCV
jgi:hypothetical protein